VRNCPFYGCHAALGFFISQGGNECALITNRYAPCQREIKGEPVEWSHCPVWEARQLPLLARRTPEARSPVEKMAGKEPPDCGPTPEMPPLPTPNLHAALTQAVALIRAWHGMGMSGDVEKQAWDIYWRNAPEMQAIREALGARPS
jgi:hypothetical protein